VTTDEANDLIAKVQTLPENEYERIRSTAEVAQADFYRLLASEILGVAYSDITTEQRTIVKTQCFARVYANYAKCPTHF
jgi:hypothetical protein